MLAHSDGDVALHALTDALLGAIADGDIGSHFPPSDEQWRGASSDRFLPTPARWSPRAAAASTTSTSRCWRKAPASAPTARRSARASPRSRVAVPLTAVSIKATTTEKLGFVGRAEGLAATASATIRLPWSE